MSDIKPALLLGMPIRRTNERTAECNSVPKLYLSVFVKLSSWIIAARPRTLSLSTTPVVVGTALAWAAERQIRWPAVLAALIGSMLIQIGTNLHNDAADSKRGGDGPDRVGPPRATASGLLEEPPSIARACDVLSRPPYGRLPSLGGRLANFPARCPPFFGWAYNGGPVPIAYTPLGELFVLAFFGVGAVCGTYWLCTGRLALVAIDAGLALGSWLEQCCWSTIVATWKPIRGWDDELWPSLRVRV